MEYLGVCSMLANNIRMSSYKAKTLVDRTTPTVVVNQPYSIQGNGGRKSVRLSDGTLIASARNASTTLYIYRSLDKGETFTSPTNINTSGIPNDWAIVNNKDYIFIILGVGSSTIQVVTHRSRDFAFIRRDNISVTSTSLGNISATINKEGTEIHVCWSDKNSLYPNTTNIRYCKGVIGSDGKGIWDTPTQVTIATNNGYSFESPSIVLDSNDYPLIIVAYRESSYYQVRAIGKNPYLPSTQSGVVSSSWKLSIVYPTSNTYQYLQTFPSACVGKDGIIYLVWNSQSSGLYSIMFSKSLDNGVTWTTANRFILTTSSYSQPSIAINFNNKLFVRWHHSSWMQNAVSSNGGDSWMFDSNLTFLNEVSLLDDNTLDFEEPLGIYRSTSNYTTYPNSILFMGKWYE